MAKGRAAKKAAAGGDSLGELLDENPDLILKATPTLDDDNITGFKLSHIGRVTS